MVFVLFLLLPVAIANLFITLFFPFHFALATVILQVLFFVASFFVFTKEIRRKRKVIKSFLLTGLHGLAAAGILVIFFNFTMKHREEGETEAVNSALNAALRYFSGDATPPPGTRTTDEINGEPQKEIIPQEPEVKPAVEDPF